MNKNNVASTWFIIINTSAGGGKGKRTWKKAKPVFDQSGISYDFDLSKYDGHIEEIAKIKIGEGYRKFIILGGDGSLHAFINSACTQQFVATNLLSIAVISSGTGNDWIRNGNTPKNVSSLIKAIKSGKMQGHDIGTIEHDNSTTYFINMVGMGFDATVLNTYYGLGGWHIGKPKYIYALILALFKYRSERIKIKKGNETIYNQRFYNLNIGLGKYCGGGMKMAPKAICNDQLFDMTLIVNLPVWKVILNVPKLFSGKYTSLKEVHEYQNKEFILTGKQLLLEADGEKLGRANSIKVFNKSKGINIIIG